MKYEIIEAFGCIILVAVLFYVLLENKDNKDIHPNID